MSPTSRNTLMIGGALILIALLLVCGPLSGRFGSGGSTVEEPPSVAAGPPVDAGAALGAAASAAMAGARLGEVGAERAAATANDDPCDRNRNDLDRDGTDCPPVVGAGTTVSDAGVGAGALTAGTAVAAGATAAAVAGGSSSGGTGGANASAVSSPPPVSAGVPSTPVSALGVVSAIPVAAVAGTGIAAASGVFDNAVASARDQNGGVGPAGRIVDRFAPPVAAPLNSGMRVASALTSGPMILPCDSPGSGCRNISTGGGSPPPGNLNPPIIPGGRPPGPIRNNPPIVPGARPPQIP